MFVSIYKVWAKLFTFLSIKICSVAYGGILLPDILDYFLILTTGGGKYNGKQCNIIDRPPWLNKFK